jgi:hypothetical protein
MMVEWMMVGIMCATAITMIAHTIDEAVSSARPLRAQSHHCVDSPAHASRFHRGSNDEAQQRAA